jgi:hypothetical protein
MKNKIESRTNYATIQQDPIKLLKAIKEHALNYQTIEGNQGACSQLSRAVIQAYDCA